MTALRSAPSLPDLERDVLALVAEGHRDQDIAVRLGLGNARKVYYRVQRIGVHLGLEAPTRPHLVDHAYVLGAVPAPAALQPLVLKAEQDHVVRMVAAGGTIERYAREQRLTQHQVAYAVRKAQEALDAVTLPALVRRAWQRQLLGPSLFAADLARMRAQRPAEPDLGRHVIVPLVSGHRLALPAEGLHPVRHLDVPSEAEALAAARILSARGGFAPLQVAPPEHPDGPFRVRWGRLEALPRPRRDLALVRPRQPPPSAGTEPPDTHQLPYQPALPEQEFIMCQHQPACPSADSPDREAARLSAHHPEQGWSLLCNGVLLFEDTGELLPDGQIIPPHRPATAVAA